MSDIKQLLEKANRKCEMRWRVFAFDPAKDNELVHTSKDAFDCIKLAGEYKMDLAKKHPDYIIEIIAESRRAKNEAYKVGDKVRITSKGTFGYGDTGIIRAINGDKFTIDFNAPNSGTIKLSAKDITKEPAQKNEAKEYKLYKLKKIGGDKVIQDVYPATSIGAALQKRIKLRKKNDGFLWEIFEIENGKGKLIDSTDHYTDEFIKNNFKGDHYRNKESAQKNEANSEQYKDAWNNLKVGDTVQVTDKDYQFTRNMKVTRIYSNGTNKIVEFDFSLPSGKKYTKPLARIYKDSNGYKAESSQKNEAKDYKVGDFVKADFNWRGVHAKPVEGKIVEKRKAIAGKGDPQPGFEYLVKAKDGNSYWVHQYGILESSRKNEEKEFTIKLVTPFGKAKVCSWKANSVDAAVKEFLDANPAYRENKKGAVIAESTQKNETFKVGDKVSYKVTLTGNSYKGIVKQIKKDIYGDELIQITEPDGRTSWKDARDLVKESIGDDIVREVKEEVKDGVKDFVQQDVDAKLNGEVTPADYQATHGEDIDDDSDSIFGDELDNVEPDEPEQIKD